MVTEHTEDERVTMYIHTQLLEADHWNKMITISFL